MVTLTLIRGLPGSGKSTYMRTHPVFKENNTAFFEADDYFTSPDDGSYKFDATKLGQAHNQCFQRTVRTLLKGQDVAVANTFTTIRELQQYYHLHLLIDDLKIEIVEMYTQYRSIHNVPVDKIDQMRRRWQPIPTHWTSATVRSVG